MKFEMVKDLDDEKFRRLTGVKRTTFSKMTLIEYSKSIRGSIPKTSGVAFQQHPGAGSRSIRV